MKKSELIERMAEKEGMSRKYAETAVDAMLKAIADALRRGETIILPGFGTFSVKERAEHQARNPLTGETFIAPARRIPTFKPSSTLKNSISCPAQKSVVASKSTNSVVEGRNSTFKDAGEEQKGRGV